MGKEKKISEQCFNHIYQISSSNQITIEVKELTRETLPLFSCNVRLQCLIMFNN